MSTASHSIPKGKKRRLRLTALGLILLGLWGLLALLLGTSVGKESHYHADLKADLQPGFGETHATPHPLDGAGDKDPPPLCGGNYCLGTEEVVVTAYLDKPIDDDADDATSSIGRPRGPEGASSPDGPSLNIAQGGPPNPFPGGLFIPGGAPGGNPNPGGPGNPNLPDNFSSPDNPSGPSNPVDTPPPDFTHLPPLNPHGPDAPGPDVPGPDRPGLNGPGPDDPGPDGPHGPDGPPGGSDQPLQIPEPLTLSLFATGVVGSALLRRRRSRASK